jgi:protein-S-isoprenylcysteine O-methyltransferase Ste14
MIQDKALFAIAKSRILVSRIFALVLVFLLIFTDQSFSQKSLLDVFLEMSGLFLLSICSFGRLWALMYISGNKRLELITDGPYSMVRHPLYVFSLIGAVGIGLASENVLIFGSIVIFYTLYYPFTILAEERNLATKFGEAYVEYMKRTPRFLPRFSQYKEAAVYEVKVHSFVMNFTDGMWFIWIYILMDFIEKLHGLGYLPILFTVP